MDKVETIVSAMAAGAGHPVVQRTQTRFRMDLVESWGIPAGEVSREASVLALPLSLDHPPSRCGPIPPAPSASYPHEPGEGSAAVSTRSTGCAATSIGGIRREPTLPEPTADCLRLPSAPESLKQICLQVQHSAELREHGGHPGNVAAVEFHGLPRRT